MRVMRVGLCQINPTVGDLEGNHRLIAAGIERARAQGVELLAFPEMVVPGYPPEDLLLKPSFIRGVIERTKSLAAPKLGAFMPIGTAQATPYGGTALSADCQRRVLGRL